MDWFDYSVCSGPASIRVVWRWFGIDLPQSTTGGKVEGMDITTRGNGGNIGGGWIKTEDRRRFGVVIHKIPRRLRSTVGAGYLTTKFRRV